MIRTIIADINPFTCQEITNLISTINSNFEIIATTGNGETAWELIQSNYPHVVFLDINLPQISGLDILKLCSGMMKPPICVIISDSSEFSYVQTALKRNAFDFILKPITKEKISDVLQQIEFHLNTEKLHIQQEYFSHLLYNHTFSYSKQDLIFAFQNVKQYSLFYICIGSYCTYNINQFDFFGDFWKKTNFNDIIQSFASELKMNPLWITQEKNICFMVSTTEQDDLYKHDLFAKKVSIFLNETPVPKTFIYGSTTDKNDLLKNQFIELDNYAKNLSIFAYTSILDLRKPIEKSNDSALLTFHEQQLLSDFIAERQLTLFHKQVDTCLLECQNSKCSQRRLNAILKRICEIANNNNLPYSLLKQVDELMSNTTSYTDIRIGIHDILDNIFLTFPEASYSQKVSIIKEYIDMHYTEQISLTVLAEKFNFSISYLSTLFKKHYHIAPSEYIIDLRMSRAKLLLADSSNSSIREVAYSVGYSDPYYFSRLFKSSTGMTPSQYRCREKSQENIQKDY